MSKLIETIILRDDVRGFKQQLHSSPITRENWGTEILDNRIDSDSTEVLCEVFDRYDKGWIQRLDITNNGLPLDDDNLRPYLRFPIKPRNHYKDLISTGVRGVGAKLEEYRIGYKEKTYYSSEDGYIRMLIKIPCTDLNGVDGVSVNELSHYKFEHTICSERVELYKTEIKNEEMFPSGRGMKQQFYIWEDTPIGELTLDNIQKLAWTRFSQCKNFKVNFSDKTTDEKTKHKKVYFHYLDEYENPVSEYTDLPKVPGLHTIKVKNTNIPSLQYEMWVCNTISQTYEIDRWDTWENRTQSGIPFHHPQFSNTLDNPVLNIVGNKDVIIFASGRDKAFPTYGKELVGVKMFIKFKTDIRQYLAAQKSEGFSQKELWDEIRKSVKKVVKENGFTNPWEHKTTKSEDSAVLQFVSRITNGSMDVRQSFELLNREYNTEELIERDNYVPFENVEHREIDLQLTYNSGKYTDLFEFQDTNKDSDFKHSDGIQARINRICSQNNIRYKNFYWVVQKYNKKHIMHLLEALQRVKFVDTIFEKIIFLTHDDIKNGFKMKDVRIVNVKDLKLKSF